MSMTTYQDMVKSHLVTIFNRGQIVTDMVLLQSDEREFIIELSMEHGYTPVFGCIRNGYFSFNGMRSQIRN